MRWEDERYVKLYTRNLPEWNALSWQARGLFCLLLREVDRAGILPLGKLGRKGIAVTVRAAWVEIQSALSELESDGCLQIKGDRLLIPGFMAAQEARQSDRARQQKSRELARLSAGNESQNVTKSHIQSHDITTRVEETRLEEKREEKEESSATRGPSPEPVSNQQQEMTDDIPGTGRSDLETDAGAAGGADPMRDDRAGRPDAGQGTIHRADGQADPVAGSGRLVGPSQRSLLPDPSPAPPERSLDDSRPVSREVSGRRRGKGKDMPYRIEDFQRALEAEAGDRVALGKVSQSVAVNVTRLIRRHPDLEDVRAAGRWWRLSTWPKEPIGWSFVVSGNQFSDAVTKGKNGARPANGHGQFDPAIDPETQRDLDVMFGRVPT